MKKKIRNILCSILFFMLGTILSGIAYSVKMNSSFGTLLFILGIFINQLALVFFLISLFQKNNKS